MEYTYKVKNAYPQINLHDCDVDNIEIKSNGIYFYFENGFKLDAETRSQSKAIIFINLDINMDEGEFYISKNKRHTSVFITKRVTLDYIISLLNNGKHLTIIEEFYDKNRMLWRGEISDKRAIRQKKQEYFEFIVNVDEPLEIIYNYNIV